MPNNCLFFGKPSPVFDPYWNNVLVLSHFDGANNSKTFVDQKGHPYGAFATAHLTTDASVFGGTSLWVSYYDEEVYINDTAMVLGSSDFTLELWARPYQFRSTMMPVISLLPNDGANGLGIGLEPTGQVTLFDRTGLIGTGTIKIAVGTWRHIAVTRSGNTLKLWVNGQLDGTFSYNKVFDDSTLRVGAARVYNQGTDVYFFGYIDELRLTKGVVRYSAPFSTPTAPFPNA